MKTNRAFAGFFSAAFMLLITFTSAGAAEADAVATTTIGKPAASRFLARAGFGGTMREIDALAAQRNHDDWFAQQANAKACLQLPRFKQAVNRVEELHRSQREAMRVETWWHCAVKGSDQLRQRMAWALSQILVVSDDSKLSPYTEALAYYYDLLSTHALGNYRSLLGDVARSPAMGVYLNMAGNQKGNPAKGIRADENFSRELMQLFTIGLVKLRINGTPVLDSAGAGIPTYTQSDVEQQASALTGWGFNGPHPMGSPSWTRPLLPIAAQHDSGAKTIIGGTMIPAGLDSETELDLVLDTLFAHPNVAPFISRQLIQRLVTSNPTPAYVARVAQVFNDNGSGEKGDLLSVAKAILLDAEASQPGRYGEVREPVERVVQLWRVFNASAASGRYDFQDPQAAFAQAPLRSPSVFNFYRPDYRSPGLLAAENLATPELQILDESTINSGAQMFEQFISLYQSRRYSTSTDEDDIRLDFRPWESMAAHPATLVDAMDLALTGNRTSAAMRKKVSAYVASIPSDDVETRIQEVLSLLMFAPQTYIQS